MRRIALATVFALPALGSAQSLVSAYDFNGTLDPYFAANSHVGSLEHRTGGNPTSAFGPTNYTVQTVGSVTKQVATVPAPSFFRALHGMGKNGGGDYVNKYSILIDMKVNGNPPWASLYSSSWDNASDGESFLRWDGNSYSVGISGVYAGTISANAWHRIVITFDGGATGNMTYYVDGSQVNQVAALDTSVDGRWSLYCWDDPDAEDHLDLFGDNDGDNLDGWVSQAAFYSEVLSPNYVGSLGGPGNPVPEPATLAALSLGALALARRRKK